MRLDPNNLEQYAKTKYINNFNMLIRS